MSGTYIHLDFEKIVKETEKALLVRLSEGDELWFPRGQVADHDDYIEGDGPGTISVTEWIAGEKGLV